MSGKGRIVNRRFGGSDLDTMERAGSGCSMPVATPAGAILCGAVHGSREAAERIHFASCKVMEFEVWHETSPGSES